ncbi:MAG: cupin domain-containing protein [Bacillota bacterium]
MDQDLGEKLKALRLENGLTQEELANRSELTKGFISQIERSLTSPSIATLKDILEVLGSTLGGFFNEHEETVHVFKKDDFYENVDDALHHKVTWIIPNAQKFDMEPIIIDIKPGGTSLTDNPHTGEEFGYVLEGEVVLKVGKTTRVVHEGESFYYKTNKPHLLENHSDKSVKILWVSTPPMF